jgi:hypothetical protein
MSEERCQGQRGESKKERIRLGTDSFHVNMFRKSLTSPPHRPLDPSLQLARDPFKEQKVPMNSQSAICQSPALCSAHADLQRDTKLLQTIPNHFPELDLRGHT